MLTYQEASEQILEKVRLLAPKEMPLLESLGLVLAEDVASPLAIPPFDNSAMDGYAVRAEDIRSATESRPVSLPIDGEIAAGALDARTLTPQTALRIMTGAPLPEGADTVVPIEDTETEGQHIRIKTALSSGRFVRAAGEDVALGAVVAAQDTEVRAAEIGMCAAAGRQKVRVYPRPRVAIISTGDELIEPGNALQPGQIYNSNAYALSAQVMEAGGTVLGRLQAQDSREDLRKAFDDCADANIILTSGGVSVGGYDYVKSVFAERGKIGFWQVAIRPGKPLAFGTWNDTLFFGLPGNPVSSMVTFELFVRPALRKMRGLTELFRPTIQARLTEPIRHEPGRQSYQRAFVTREDDGYLVQSVGGQGSHQMRAMVLSNALLILPAHVAEAPAGESVTVLLLDSAAPG
jgi:molybdopterin molybdotransferase